ncbi:MAG: potassium transport protein Kup [Syntrophus sp. PtaU1.Bin208]|nr:MAG: potassium transport protein Kup [Syntrophus sp. PtaU1.Bin208]
MDHHPDERHFSSFQDHHSDSQGNGKGKFLLLALGALGVVFGDLGTSPLYTIRECFYGPHAIDLSRANLMGTLSLIFWSMTMVISIKYVVFIMRADNRGEGGIFALLGLISRSATKISPRQRAIVMLAGILGAGLLCGEGIITPAISVLSAIEGLEVATKAAKPVVVPLTCIILLMLFLVQRRGTADIGIVFGPIMLLWFASLSFLGILQILNEPRVLSAINPIFAFNFFAHNKFHGFVVLGSVVLCFTGVEALYADLGHFGRNAIRFSWLAVAYPALLLNYFGQGALLLHHPEMKVNPFYGVVPELLLYPMVGLATVAAVIASQALISGVFSITQQGIQLGFLPRIRIVHTSSEMEGQIYIPFVNYALMISCIGVVLGFGASSGLAGAYGLSVTGTMTISSFLFFLVLVNRLRWSPWKAIPLVATFLVFDLSYLGANFLKIVDGGWFTLLAAMIITVVMTTWRRGREELNRKLQGERLPVEIFLDELAEHSLPRVPGTAIFMTISPAGIPLTLLHHVKHNHMLHEKVVLLTIRSVGVPTVPERERVTVEDLGQGFYRVEAVDGFMQKPDVPDILRIAAAQGLVTDPMTTTFYLGRELLLTTGDAKMLRWRKSLFAFMSRNAGTPAAYFNLPVNRVVELGAQVEI